MTKSKLRKLLTKPKFRAWLEAKKPRAVIGVSGLGDKCPIARYIQDNTNKDTPTWAVGNMWAQRDFIDTPDGRFDPPEWYINFTTTADSSGHCHITASHALKILDGIK